MKLINPIEKVELIDPFQYIVIYTKDELSDFKRNSSVALSSGEPSGARAMNKLKDIKH